MKDIENVMTAMDKDLEIKRLLELYFEGETTLAQERRLRDYFAAAEASDGSAGATVNKGAITPELEYAKAMFGFFGSAAQDSSSAALRLPFENFMNDTVSTGERDSENMAAGHELTDSPTVKHMRGLRLPVSAKSRRMIFLRRAVSIASVVLVAAAGVAFGLLYSPKPVIYCYVNGEPVTDIDYAHRQAEMATRILAGNLKTSAEGFDTAVDASRRMEQLVEALQEQTKP